MVEVGEVVVVCNEQQQHSLYLHLQPRPDLLPGQMVLVTLPGEPERENWAELLISNELAGQYVEVVVVVVRIDQDRCDVC